ncbi:MAG: PhoH family protein [Candidatus Omnitrophota bacterium]|nr:PhoH family protein [Candidatus Omnitrophota bacterium]
MEAKQKKLFIVDTNVILHDADCIYQFKTNDVVIPITVLEELDKFKKGKDTLNYQAREFLRSIDAISSEQIFDKGVSIGADKGSLMIKLDEKFHDEFAFNFTPSNPDHHILNIAFRLFKEHPFREVILVTKDLNLRMKAKAIGLKANDYTSDHVKEISQLYTGYRVQEDVSPEIIDELYKKPHEVDNGRIKFKKDLLPNEYIIMRSGKQSVLARYDSVKQKIKRVEKLFAHGIVPRNAEQTFALDALMNPDIKLVTITGKAGTGKTLLALAAALENKKDYRQLFVARPVVPLSNKDLGFLPGDIAEKLDPYLQPLFDNLGVIKKEYLESNKTHVQTKTVLEREKLVIAPLSYIRGRSLVNIFFIVDEAQNLTPHEIKTIITRAGENTKLVFTGDIFQIDHPYLDLYSNGLSYLIEKMQEQKIYTHINLEKRERSELADLGNELL